MSELPLPRTSSILLDPLEAMTLIGLEAMSVRYRGPLTTTVEAEAHYHDGDGWPEDVDYDDRLPSRHRAPLSPEVLEAFDRDRIDDPEGDVF